MVRNDGGRLFKTSGPLTANARRPSSVRVRRMTAAHVEAERRDRRCGSDAQNTNLPPILHRFGVIAFKCQKSLYFATPFACKSPTEGFPWEDLRKMFGECQWMAKVPDGEKKLPKILTGWVVCTNVTDRWHTDRQTERR